MGSGTKRFFKAKFMAPVGKFETVRIPFNSFTSFFNGITGDPIVSCGENEEYCPDQDTLEELNTISFWGEGVEGDVHLEVREITAYGCTPGTATELAINNTSSASYSYYLTIGAVAVLVCIIVRFRARKLQIGPPLLG